jgi:hypothetical protein
MVLLIVASLYLIVGIIAGLMLYHAANEDANAPGFDTSDWLILVGFSLVWPWFAVVYLAWSFSDWLRAGRKS